MILAIDTGNTHIVLGCIDEKGEISHIIRLETNLKKTEYEYASDIKQILELENVDRFAFTDAVISSSVPPLRIHGCGHLFVSPSADRDPQESGEDHLRYRRDGRRCRRQDGTGYRTG